MKKLLLFIACIVPISIGLGHATDRYVTPAGSNSNDGMSRATEFSGIQYAINTAQTGDTIYLGTGTYLQSGTITKPLTIRVMGTGITILDGISYPVTAAGLRINGGVNNLTISDLSITRFDRGIYRNNGNPNSNWLVENVTTSDNRTAGIFFQGVGIVSNMQFIGIEANYNNQTAIGRGIFFSRNE